MKRFQGHPFSNNIDRQFGPNPAFALAIIGISVVAFGGVAANAGVFDTLNDLISKYNDNCPF